MPRRRERIDEGVYVDAHGWAATVKVGRIQRERRFLPDTSLDVIQAWRSRTRGELLEERDTLATTEGPIPLRGTFAADLPRYLNRIAGRVSFKADRSHLSAWLPHIGPMKRTAIRPSHVQVAITSWQHAGKSARTIRHRRRVLRELYQALDGAHARPPLAGVKIPRIPDPHPVPVPWATVKAVAKSLKAGKRHAKGYGDDSAQGYARFLVRATTGQRPAQIMRAEPGDVDLKRRIWFVRAAKGGTAIPLPLDAEMVKAWRVFARVKAWGAFDTRSFSKLLRRHGWPSNVRPYSLRHTFAIDRLLKGVRLDDLQGLLGHKQIETTRAHYAPVLLARLRKATKRGRRIA